eukprot:TRINITY_DN106757_c0_g1_i1.p1 TRINITY_DN106757_c0_g1~~TRINITY_DN106757_c0_g1_i1.p1  ORF type:complete len:139 (-),score=4.80 TRINITY_DN106757_c0_g1_i1:89-505(-)
MREAPSRGHVKLCTTLECLVDFENLFWSRLLHMLPIVVVGPQRRPLVAHELFESRRSLETLSHFRRKGQQVQHKWPEPISSKSGDGKTKTFSITSMYEEYNQHRMQYVTEATNGYLNNTRVNVTSNGIALSVRRPRHV